MPRRKKNKKNRKNNAKKSRNQENSALLTHDAVRTCIDDDSFNKSKPLSPLGFVTPLKDQNQKKHVTGPFEDDLSPIRITPLNKKRSINVSKGKKYGSMNVTNLNLLFDSNYAENISNSKSDIFINKTNSSYKKRSHSSIPKLHSPALETPLALQESQKPSDASKRNEISETPKVSKILLIDRTKSDGMYNTQPLNNHKPVSDKVSHNRSKFYKGEVNINPYLNRESNVLNKDGSFGEISFFSSNLFQHKSSSTPVEKLHEAHNLMNYVKDSLRKDNVNECVGVIEGMNLPNNFSAASNLDTNLNLNKTPLSEKVLNKEHGMTNLRHPVSLAKRRSYRGSPYSDKILYQSRVYNRKQTLAYSRLNRSRRSSVDSVESVSRHSRSGIGEKLMSRLKRYTKISQRWSVRVMELCTQLGAQLKNSLSSMCNLYSDKATLENSEKPTCRCDEYREEISQLNLKIDELSEEVRTVKLQMQQEKSNKENIELLNQELNKVREELSQFKDLRTELEALKEQLKCVKPVTRETSIPIPPPPPPLLPCIPPPPPPPPLPLSMPDCTTVKILRNTKAKSICTDNSRPIISLDDILKVKLKKTSERANSFTPITRRLSQPVVSTDMLRQVKLRPASRPSFRPDTPDIGASSVSTSPHSSLCRRNLMGKRERDGS